MRQRSGLLMGRNICRLLSKLGDDFLEMGIGVEALKIVFGHETIGVFISTIDGFSQILKRVIGTVGSHRYAGKGIPRRERVSMPATPCSCKSGLVIPMAIQL